jgi:hypothetical protein
MSAPRRYASATIRQAAGFRRVRKEAPPEGARGITIVRMGPVFFSVREAELRERIRYKINIGCDKNNQTSRKKKRRFK